MLGWINESFPACGAFLKEARKSLPDASGPIIRPAGDVGYDTLIWPHLGHL